MSIFKMFIVFMKCKFNCVLCKSTLLHRKCINYNSVRRMTERLPILVTACVHLKEGENL